MDAEDAQAQIPKKAVRSLKTRLQLVKKHLEPLLSKPLNEVYSKLPLDERYELQVLLSYSLNTLFYIYMRTQGTDPQKHEVMNELVRVQQYIQKLKKAQGRGLKPTLKVDKEAAARFVKSAIKESNNTETPQKRTVKEPEEESSSSSEEEVEELSDKKNKKRKVDAFSKRKEAPRRKKTKKN